MLPEKILQSDLLDILFENRNKAYGAYALRRSYNKKIMTSLGATFFIVLVFSIFQCMHPVHKPVFITRTVFLPDPELTEIKMPEKPVAPAAQKNASMHVKQEIYSAPVMEKDNIETRMPDVNILEKNMIGNIKVLGDEDPGSVQPAAGPGETAPGISMKTSSNNVFGPLHWAQEMPEYPGGIEALKKFMLRHLRQPDNLQPGEKVIVKAVFVVNGEGKIEQVKIISGGRNDLDEEVLRVINKMPLWKPGRQNGNAVAVYFNLPVTFVNNEEE